MRDEDLRKGKWCAVLCTCVRVVLLKLAFTVSCGSLNIARIHRLICIEVIWDHYAHSWAEDHIPPFSTV